VKTLEQQFRDWEGNLFGFGYGTGEMPVLTSLRTFLEAMPDSGSYDYKVLEKAAGETVSWLLINVLARADHIEYGTSPRYGWLTESGKALREFITARTPEQLYEIATGRPDDFSGADIPCYPEHCNCDDGDCRPGNPFWKKSG